MERVGSVYCWALVLMAGAEGPGRGGCAAPACNGAGTWDVVLVDGSCWKSAMAALVGLVYWSGELYSDCCCCCADDKCVWGEAAVLGMCSSGAVLTMWVANVGVCLARGGAS